MKNLVFISIITLYSTAIVAANCTALDVDKSAIAAVFNEHQNSEKKYLENWNNTTLVADDIIREVKTDLCAALGSSIQSCSAEAIGLAPGGQNDAYSIKLTWRSDPKRILFIAPGLDKALLWQSDTPNSSANPVEYMYFKANDSNSTKLAVYRDSDNLSCILDSSSSLNTGPTTFNNGLEVANPNRDLGETNSSNHCTITHTDRRFRLTCGSIQYTDFTASDYTNMVSELLP